MGIIPGLVRHSGFLGLKRDYFGLVATPYRLVFVHISRDVQNNAISQTNANAKASGKGFFGVAIAQMRWLDVVVQQIRETPVDALFQRYPGTFQIDNRVIQRIRFRERSTDDGTSVEHRMQIDIIGGKIIFFLSISNKKTVVNLLRQVVPHAVR